MKPNRTTKKCSCCKQILPVNHFGTYKNTVKGKEYTNLRSVCHRCEADKINKRYHSSSEIREYTVKKTRERRAELLKTETGRALLAEINRKTMQKYYEKNKDMICKAVQVNYDLKKSGIADALWKRADGRCEECGKVLEKKRGGYAKHHMNGDRDDNRLENLLLLCTKHHLHLYHEQRVIA